MVLVYAGGHLSGAHYNPAVTVALLLRGACERKLVLPYLAAQFSGALLAAGSVAILKTKPLPTVAPEVLPALLAEVLFTFLLIWVIINVATLKSTSGNNYFGFAIGGTVMTGAFTVGGISGAVFNPAVCAGLLALGVIPIGSAWIYLVANFGASFLTAFAAKAVLDPVASAAT